MAAKEIYVTINPNAEVEVEAKGFQGQGCAAIVDALSAGGEILESKTLPEYKEREQVLVRK
jgi:NifU-like protein involved in Fe-S cluster formation